MSTGYSMRALSIHTGGAGAGGRSSSPAIRCPPPVPINPPPHPPLIFPGTIPTSLISSVLLPCLDADGQSSSLASTVLLPFPSAPNILLLLWPSAAIFKSCGVHRRKNIRRPNVLNQRYFGVSATRSPPTTAGAHRDALPPSSVRHLSKMGGSSLACRPTGTTRLRTP